MTSLFVAELGCHVLWRLESGFRGMKLLVLKNQTVALKTGRRVSPKEAEAFVLAHANWVRGQWRKLEIFFARFPPKCFRNGEEFPYLGQTRKLTYLRSAVKKPRLQFTGALVICEVPLSVYNATFLWAPQPAMQADVLNLYRAEAKRLITERCLMVAERMELKPRSLVFRSQRTLWGSCTARGDISLNLRLVGAPLEVIDYVAIHELAHLVHHNHSPEFWRLVQQYAPDLVESKKWLKNHNFSFDFLGKESDLYCSKLEKEFNHPESRMEFRVARQVVLGE